jgi:hypothetical protein
MAKPKLNGHSKPPKKIKRIEPKSITLATVSVTADKNIGGREAFNTVTDYKIALRAEKRRLRSASSNLPLLKDTYDRHSTPGRMATYRPEFAEVARIVCSVYGSSVEELGRFFGVTPGWIRHWMKEYPAFDKAVNDRATEINVQIMGRLARRALGFYAKTEKIFYDVKRGDVIKVPTKEYYPPSENAIFFWLKNRMADEWKDVKDVNLEETRKITMEIYKNFDTMTSEQATDAYQELIKIEGTASKAKTKDITDVPLDERDPGTRTKDSV